MSQPTSFSMPPVSRRQMLATTALAGTAGMLGALVGCTTKPKPSDPQVVPDAAPDAAPDWGSLAPPAPREFRAAWVATGANIDWPSKKGLSTESQQAELRTILDTCVALKFNAVILQVRTSADALYASALEPWSEFLTGVQGQAPVPFYDPLALWIEEAHARGLELHAWFNPFRARQTEAKATLAPTHVSKTHPEWVKTYGKQLWIDPGDSNAADHTLAVFMDVLRRYDVDGIHIDDYFYPYPVTHSADSKIEVDFPDGPAWQRYRSGGGTLAREDWRRSNVDQLIERIYTGLRQTKPWVRFGISPFGLGKPDLRPEGIKGFSQYHKLYADVELWLEKGWLDYLVPQLYWARNQKEQAFVPLLDYWHRQNPLKRHVWAGLFTSRVQASATNAKTAWPVEEIAGQIHAVRERAPASGHVHFSMVALVQNRQGLKDTLQTQLYTDKALVPACPWLEADAPQKPMLTALGSAPAGTHMQLQLGLAPDSKAATRWVLWMRHGERWSVQIQPQALFQVPLQDTVTGSKLTAVVASAVDRVGNESPRAGLGWNG